MGKNGRKFPEIDRGGEEMRILMIGWYKPQVGGGSQVIQNLSRQLSTEHKVIVINMEEKGLPTGLGHWKDGKIEVYQE